MPYVTKHSLRATTVNALSVKECAHNDPLNQGEQEWCKAYEANADYPNGESENKYTFIQRVK